MLHPVRWTIIGIIFTLGVSAAILCLYWIVETRRRHAHRSYLGHQDANFSTCALEAGLLTRERAAQCGCAPNESCVDLSRYFPEKTSLSSLPRPQLVATAPVPKKIWQTVDTGATPGPTRAGWIWTRADPAAQRESLDRLFAQEPAWKQLVKNIVCQESLANVWRLAMGYVEGGLVLTKNMIVTEEPVFEPGLLHLARAPNSAETTHLFGKGAVRHDLFAVHPRHPAVFDALGQALANLGTLRDHEDQRFLRLYRQRPDSAEHRRDCATGDVPFSYQIYNQLETVIATTISPALTRVVVSQPTRQTKKTSPTILRTHSERVPAIVHLSWKSRDKVPQKIWDHLATVIPDEYEVNFYSNDDCERYILDKYGQHVLDLYQSIPKGAHRADAFRYAILYHKGGIWLDIKTLPKIPIDQIFNRSVDFTTALTPSTGLVYQGVLSAVPKLAMLHQCFFDSLKYGTAATRLSRGYIGNLVFMTNLLKRNALAPDLRLGFNLGERFNFELLEERVRNGGTDRYGLDSQLYNGKGVHVAKTRDDDFPWT
jgi:hypothetical protein